MWKVAKQQPQWVQMIQMMGTMKVTTANITAFVNSGFVAKFGHSSAPTHAALPLLLTYAPSSGIE